MSWQNQSSSLVYQVATITIIAQIIYQIVCILDVFLQYQY